MTTIIDKLKDGHLQFREDIYLQEQEKFQALAQAQHPKVLMIACSDSRVDPAIVTQAEAGELFMVRNVANLVPAYNESGADHHTGTTAALEYGVQVINVEHIVVMGHYGCGGIQALVQNDPAVAESLPGVAKWLEIGTQARTATLDALPEAPLDQQCRHCEHESVRQSLEKLMTFPFIAERVNAGTLHLHGWYFDLRTGCLQVLNTETQEFQAVAA